MSSEQEAILATNAAFYRAFEKKNIETMEAVWSRGTGSLCIHPGRAVLKGWDQIRASWVQIFKNTTYLEIEIEIDHVEITGDLAYVVLIEHVLQAAGGRKAQAQSTATNIFERMGGAWYLIHHHGSPLVR